MKVIVVANQKGGSGKSTVLAHLAVTAEHAGDGPVVISDTDPQGTVADWFNQRRDQAIEVPRYVTLTLPKLKAEIAALDKAGASHLFIDTAPSIGDVNAKVFEQADVILIPLNPTPADLRSLAKGLPLIKGSGKPFYFVFARVRANLKANDGAAIALHSLGLLLPTRMHERIIYAEAFGHGRTAIDIEPNGVAAKELMGIWSDLKAMLGKS